MLRRVGLQESPLAVEVAVVANVVVVRNSTGHNLVMVLSSCMTQLNQARPASEVSPATTPKGL